MTDRNDHLTTAARRIIQVMYADACKRQEPSSTLTEEQLVQRTAACPDCVATACRVLVERNILIQTIEKPGPSDLNGEGVNLVALFELAPDALATLEAKNSRMAATQDYYAAMDAWVHRDRPSRQPKAPAWMIQSEWTSIEINL